MRLYIALILLAISLVLGGCFGSESNSGTDPVSSGMTYYYAEFKDVAIPKEMTAQNKETFITYSSDGTKLGTQIFSGRVEMASLVEAMCGHLQRDGWDLRSSFRSTRSILIFERADRMCSIYIGDGMIETSMLIFVSPKLASGALQYSVPASTSTEPLGTSDPMVHSSAAAASTTGSVNDGNVTVYPVTTSSGAAR